MAVVPEGVLTNGQGAINTLNQEPGARFKQGGSLSILPETDPKLTNALETDPKILAGDYSDVFQTLPYTPPADGNTGMTLYNSTSSTPPSSAPPVSTTVTPPKPVATQTPPAKPTLRDIADKNGYTLNYDSSKNVVYVSNPNTGKSIEFNGGQGGAYGIGTVTPADGNGYHVVDDIAAFEKALGGTGTSIAAPSFEEATGLTPDQTQGGQAVQPGGATGPSIVDKPIEFPQIQGPGTYTSPYTESLNGLIKDLKNSKFVYDPETDPLWQQAKKDITSSTKAAMNARGILGSTITSDRITQVMASALPEYEARAYERYKGEIEKLINVFDMTLKMDDRDYSRWKDNWEMNYKATVANWDRQNQLFNQNIVKYDAAMKKIDELGYVDNETALVTGLPVGSLSKGEREYVRQKADKIFFQKIEYNMNTALEGWKFEKEKEMIRYRDNIDRDTYKFKKGVDSVFAKDMADYELDQWYEKADYTQQQNIKMMGVELDFWKQKEDYSQKIWGEQRDRIENFDQYMAWYGTQLDRETAALKSSAAAGNFNVNGFAKNMNESANKNAVLIAGAQAQNLIGKTYKGVDSNGKPTTSTVAKIKYDSTTNSYQGYDNQDNMIAGATVSKDDYLQEGLAQYMASIGDTIPAANVAQITDTIAMETGDMVIANMAKPYVYALALASRIVVSNDPEATMENLTLAAQNPTKFGIPGTATEQQAIISALAELIKYK